MYRDAGLLRAVLGLVLVGAPACTAIYGVDFDSAYPRAADAAAPVSPTDDANVPEGGAPVVPDPVAVGPDGTCASDRKKCDALCVSLVDPTYGCAMASCVPCSIAHGVAACAVGACGVGSCAAGYVPEGAACVQDVGDERVSVGSRYTCGVKSDSSVT